MKDSFRDPHYMHTTKMSSETKKPVPRNRQNCNRLHTDCGMTLEQTFLVVFGHQTRYMIVYTRAPHVLLKQQLKQLMFSRFMKLYRKSFLTLDLKKIDFCSKGLLH